MLNQLFFLIWLYTINICNSLPAEYCNIPFNGSNCGMEPTPVFAYYKPGSRSEIKYWKGCPTLNKFTNEFTCSYFCIGRLEENEISDEDFAYIESDSCDSCDSCAGVLNTQDCNKGPQLVYTYDSKENHCIEGKWRGCETSNKFPTQEACQRKCKMEKLVNILTAENMIEEMVEEMDDAIPAESL